MSNETIYLCGQPVSQQSLRAAHRMLTAMDDLDHESGRDTPAWIITARLAVAEILQQEETDETESNA